MKVQTDFGIQEIKPQKIFHWEGIKFAIIKRPETDKELIMQRVVEYQTSEALPIQIYRGDTLKIIEQKAINSLSVRITPEELIKRIKNSIILNN